MFGLWNLLYLHTMKNIMFYCWQVIIVMIYTPYETLYFNSLIPGGSSNSKNVISKQMLWIKFISTSCELLFRWMPQGTSDGTDHKSALVRAMAWCCQATSHYLSKCWPRSMSPHSSQGHSDLKSSALQRYTRTQLLCLYPVLLKKHDTVSKLFPCGKGPFHMLH